MSECVTVLCVEDRDDGETFDRHFANDRERRREYASHEPRRLQRYGRVEISEHAAQTALLGAIYEEMLPDVVLIDYVLRGQGRNKYEPGGLALMRWIRDEFAKRRLPLPACVLCTSEFSPGLAQAFVRCGGVQAIKRTADWPDEIAAIWQGYDWHTDGDGHWTHKPKPGYPAITLAPTIAALLPFLEVDTPNTAIAAALGIAEKTLHQRRRTLVQRINDQVPSRLFADGKPLLLSGRSSSLAQIALDCGVVWVPLAYAQIVDGA